MPLLRGPEPRGVGKGDAVEFNIRHRLIKRTFHLNQRFQRGPKNARGRQIFAAARPVIDFAVAHTPFTGRIEELNGVGEEKRRLIFLVHRHWRPWVLKLEVAFRLIKGQAKHSFTPSTWMVFTRNTAISQTWSTAIGGSTARDAPPPARAGCRYHGSLIGFIPRDEARESFAVWFAGANGFRAVHPKLAEFHNLAVDTRGIRHPDVSERHWRQAGHAGSQFPTVNFDAA